MRKILFNSFFVFSILFFSGCYILNPSVMFRTGKDFNYSPYNDSVHSPEYIISPNDILEFQLYSNDGFKLIDLTTVSSQSTYSQNLRNGIDFLVEGDGSVKLPILGRVAIKGLSIRSAEKMLEEKYSAYYNKPYAIIRVNNRRVIIFPGLAGSARVLPLVNNNTTLLEALALAGGISQNGKARRVKLIRGNLQKPEVYLINLATIEGLNKADIILQGNDIIYVEPRLNITQEVVSRLTLIISLLSSTLIIYSFVK